MGLGGKQKVVDLEVELKRDSTVMYNNARLWKRTFISGVKWSSKNEDDRCWYRGKLHQRFQRVYPDLFYTHMVLYMQHINKHLADIH